MKKRDTCVWINELHILGAMTVKELFDNTDITSGR
jgi:hypothetical protein